MSWEAMLERIRLSMLQYWPEKCLALGPGRLSQLISDSVDAAWAYGFHDEMLIQRYVNLVFTLGEEFESAYPWTSKILNDCTLGEDGRLDAIWQRLREVTKPRDR